MRSKTQKLILKYAVIFLLLGLLVLMLAACAKKKKTQTSSEGAAAPVESEAAGDFIIVGEDGGKPLIFYNLNNVSSVKELAEYVDIAYDFENKPEIILAEVDAPEGVFEQVREMLDEKGVVYVITEDAE